VVVSRAGDLGGWMLLIYTDANFKTDMQESRARTRLNITDWLLLIKLEPMVCLLL
jgi:hypothetical protein